MRIQEHIIESTQKAAEEVFRYARAVPENQLEWKPLYTGRSVLDLARELAKTPDWAYDTLTLDTQPDEAEFEAQKEEMESWKTIAECEAQCYQRLKRFYEAVRQLPDEKLKETKWLPYEGGRDFTYTEMIDYPRWNFNYHLGQIGYIQLLYGDREMH